MRTKNFIKNFKAGLVKQLLTEFLRFFVRTVFIYTLSAEYLGINGLFTNILTFLSIAELGFSTSVSYALYKPLANGDTEGIKSIICLYKKAYRFIGMLVFAIGMLIMPFLPHLTQGGTDLVNIYFVFFLYLINIVSGYLFFAYRTTILHADQKAHIAYKVTSYAQLLLCVFQLGSLILFRNHKELSFYLYNISQVVTTIFINLYTAKITNKLYPYLTQKDVQPLEKAIKDKIFNNIKALSLSNISAVLLRSIDSIVISAFMMNGLFTIGLYSNYVVLLDAVTSFLKILTNSLVAGMGNFYVTESKEKNKELLNGLDLAYFWMFGFCAVCYYALIQPFIGFIWLDETYLLSNRVAFLVALNFTIGAPMGGVLRYINSAGLYYETRYRYIVSAVLNVVLSILFVSTFNWGVEGVILATTICTFFSHILLPITVYKNIFKESSGTYYVNYFVKIITLVGTIYITRLVCDILLPNINLLTFVGRALIAVMLPNLLWVVMFGRTHSFIFAKEKALGIIKNR